jgi:toxin ParE1/3/4
MAKAHQTPEVEDALIDYARHIAKDNPAAALRWVDDMEKAFDLIATQPEIGERVQTGRFGVARRHVAGNYLIYYQTVEDGIRVVFVIHGARDHEQYV